MPAKGRGTTAEKFLTDADKVTSELVWQNPDNSLMFNSPVLKDGVFYGISNKNNVFCVDVENGKTAWSASLASTANQQREAGVVEGTRWLWFARRCRFRAVCVDT